jgi:hypothetical protein
MSLVGCDSDSKAPTFTIKVMGTDGMQVQGAVAVVDSDGTSQTKSVEGTVPQVFELQTSMASLTLQKMTEEGELTLEAYKDGKLLKTESTTAPYGCVAIVVQ